MGGLLIAYISMNEISGGAGVVAGFNMLVEQAPDKFDMILSKDNPHYMSLPGISVLVGGMWIMNLSYWGFNQYIIQRALAAKSNREAQKGIMFAAFLKMLMPVLVVLPGIAAVILAPDLTVSDKAYPEIMKLLPVGIKGLVFAALIAAIISSLASMMNSIATIFTMDIVAHHSDRSEQQLVTIGRVTSLSALIIAVSPVSLRRASWRSSCWRYSGKEPRRTVRSGRRLDRRYSRSAAISTGRRCRLLIASAWHLFCACCLACSCHSWKARATTRRRLTIRQSIQPQVPPLTSRRWLLY
jgi:hypothetical protein